MSCQAFEATMGIRFSFFFLIVSRGNDQHKCCMYHFENSQDNALNVYKWDKWFPVGMLIKYPSSISLQHTHRWWAVIKPLRVAWLWSSRSGSAHRLHKAASGPAKNQTLWTTDKKMGHLKPIQIYGVNYLKAAIIYLDTETVIRRGSVHFLGRQRGVDITITKVCNKLEMPWLLEKPHRHSQLNHTLVLICLFILPKVIVGI